DYFCQSGDSSADHYIF
nr:immunoglobulin light chain junction region [Macaca mulatta]